MFAAVIMAGGMGKRFAAGYKLVAPIQGKPLIRLAAENALSVFSRVILVTGYRADLVYEVVKDLPLTICHNSLWGEGQSTTVKCGLRALRNEVPEGVCLIPGDQGFVKPSTMECLCRTSGQHPADILVPFYNGQQGNPTMFPSCVLDSLYRMTTGDRGGRALLKQRGFYQVDTDDPGVLQDIDTEEDYERYAKEGNKNEQ